MEQNNNDVLAVLDVCNRSFNLKIGNYTIGRDSKDFKHDICIDNESVDVKHSVIEMRLYGAKIVDLFSKFGTFVDEEDIGKFNFFDIYKSVALRFGEVGAQFRLITESDSGFLGFNNSKDVSDIIPQSPQDCTVERQNSQISGRSRLRIVSRKSVSSNEVGSTTTHTSLSKEERMSIMTIVPSTQIEGNVDIFANVTDENIRKNIEKMEEEDDFYVPETQEIFQKPNELSVNSQAIIRLCTQELEDIDDKSNDSDNLLGNFNSSLIVPHIKHSPVVITEIKDELNAGIEKASNNNIKNLTSNIAENPLIVDNFDADVETDAEEEMSALNWSEKTFNQTKRKSIEAKSASVTPDLDLNLVPLEKEASVTPDLEFKENKSGSVTPDLDLPATREREYQQDYNNITPTQQFIPNKEPLFSAHSDQKKSSTINISPSNKENLDETQLFVLDKSTDKSRGSINSSHDDSVFLKPGFPKAANAISTPRSGTSCEDDIYLGPTQPFPGREIILNNKEKNENEDFNYLEATQPFYFKKPDQDCNQEIEPSISPCILESDEEENNSEFCFRETLIVGKEQDKNEPAKQNTDDLQDKRQKRNKLLSSSEDEEASLKKQSTKLKQKSKLMHSRSSSKSRSRNNSRSAIEDTSFDIQQTPDVDFLHLPNTNEIKEAGKVFSEMSRGVKRTKVLLEESSSNDSTSDDEINSKNTSILKKQHTAKPPNLRIRTPEKNVKKPVVRLRRKEIEEKKAENEARKEITDNNAPHSRPKRQLSKLKDEKLITKKSVEGNNKKEKHSKSNLRKIMPSTSTSKDDDIRENLIEPSESTRSNLRNAKSTSKSSENINENSKKEHENINVQSFTKDQRAIKSIKSKKGVYDDSADLRTKSSRSKKGLEIHETNSENGDNLPTVSKLACRTSSRLKSVPAYIADYVISPPKSVEIDKSSRQDRKHPNQIQSSDSEKSAEKKRSKENKSKESRGIKGADSNLSGRPAGRTSSRLKSVPAYIADYVTSPPKTVEIDKSPRRNRRRPNQIQSSDSETSTENKRSKANKSKESSDIKGADGKLRGRSTRKKIASLKLAETEEVSKASIRIIERTTTKNQEEMIKSSANPKKRSSEVKTDDIKANKKTKSNSHSLSSENEPSTSVQGTRKSARQAKHRIAFTRVDSTPFQSTIQKIGAEIVDNPRECTVLVAEKVIRTWKFLAAVARGVPIVSPKWFENLDTNEDYSSLFDDCIIRDVAAEKHYKFSLKKSLHLARKKPIFRDFEFFLTRGIKPTPPELLQIIECGEGKVLNKLPQENVDITHFYIVSDKEDIALWPKFRRAIPGVQIVCTEAIMLAVIQQCINFRSFLLS